MRNQASRLLWAIAIMSACGGSPAAPAPAPTAGGEEPPPRVAPVGPVQSYVTASHRAIVKIDLTLVRESPVGADISSLIRAYPAWQQLLGSSGIDPVRDFDRVLIAGTASVTGSGVMLVRHHLEESDLRQRVLQMAISQGERAEWRQEQGFSVVDWPAQTDPPRVVVLTGPHELVVTTRDDLGRVLEVAADHRARRVGDETIEPALQLENDVLATIDAADVAESMRGRFEYPPDAYRVVLRRQDEGSRMSIAAQATYPDEGAATNARNFITQMRDRYADHMIVRAIGLDRALRAARIGGEGNQLSLDASLTMDEMQRALGLVALGQIGGG